MRFSVTSFVITAVAISGAVFYSSFPVYAQATTGEIHGVVQDPQQAVVLRRSSSRLTNVGRNAVAFAVGADAVTRWELFC